MMCITDERGSALVITLMGTVLLTVLGVALLLNATTETMISANYRTAQEAMYGADAGLERSIEDLLRAGDWNAVLAGSEKSTFVDGDQDRRAPDGSPVDLVALTAAVQGDSDARYGADPNRPMWTPYAHATLSQLLPGDAILTRGYVVVWVADDSAEVDGDQKSDTNGILLLHAEALGEGGSRKAVEATVSKSGSTASNDHGYTGQRGLGEQNRRSRLHDVQTPGQALTRMQMDLATGGMVVQ